MTEKDILEMAKKMGLNIERIAESIKSNPKEVGDVIQKAYNFKIKAGKK